LAQHGQRFAKSAPTRAPVEAGGAEGGGILLDTVHGDEFDDQFDDELLVQG
jgi:hypothetical protein